MKDFNDKLKEIRIAKGYTQKEAAKALEISSTGYAGYEQGYREPDLKSLYKICRYFGVSSDYLIGLSEDESASWISEGNLETPLPHVSKRAEQEEEEDNSPPVRIRYAARGEGNLYADTTEKKLKMLHEALLRNKINPEDDGI